jgi:hypothetical protein
MSVVILYIFVAILIFALVRMLTMPSLAFGICISTYGLEQIASIVIPAFQVELAAFNIIIGSFVVIAACWGFVSGNIKIYTLSKISLGLIAVFAYMLYFWLSYYWSPFYDIKSSLWEIPNFILYVLILPLLLEGPEQMRKSLRIINVMLTIGCTGLLLTPGFTLSHNLGRYVVITDSGLLADGSNPLAMADMAIYLSMISLYFLFSNERIAKFNRVTIKKYLLLTIVWVGLGIGAWISFVSSRGETLAGLIAACILIIVFKAKNLKRAAIITLTCIVIIAAILIPTYSAFYDIIVSNSPVFEREAFTIGAESRENLAKDSILLFGKTPATVAFGIGARGCEDFLKTYPHTILVQALVETGIFGLCMLCVCYGFTVSFGIKVVNRAKYYNDKNAIALSALFISLLCYQILIESKKGSLHFHFPFMWIVITLFAYSKIDQYLEKRYSRIHKVEHSKITL